MNVPIPDVRVAILSLLSLALSACVTFERVRDGMRRNAEQQADRGVMRLQRVSPVAAP